MARPKFHVQHFLACLNAPWEGLPGPRTLRTLEGVGYIHRVPPATEFPFEVPEFWLYVRMYLRNGIGGPRHFGVELVWEDDPDGRPVVAQHPWVRLDFTPTSPVVSLAWAIRPVVFPGPGRYEFRLLCRTRSWRGTGGRVVSRDHIRIEV